MKLLCEEFMLCKSASVRAIVISRTFITVGRFPLEILLHLVIAYIFEPSLTNTELLKVVIMFKKDVHTLSAVVVALPKIIRYGIFDSNLNQEKVWRASELESVQAS